LVKVDEDLAFRDLGNVVHALARIVSNPRILIGEACEDGGYDFFEVASDFLQHPSAHIVVLPGLRCIPGPKLSRPPPVR
jgi:hypothetical protein